MAEYLSPGVYVEEFSSGIKPMEGVSTSTVGFLGMAQRGPVKGVPEFVGSFGEFQRIFGGYLPESYKERRFLPLAVEQFFANGGSRCFVVRLLKEAGTECASLQVGDVKFTAANPGTWGNSLSVTCGKSPADPKLYQLTVKVDGESYAENYQDVSMDSASKSFIVRLLEKSLLIRGEYTGKADFDLYQAFQSGQTSPAEGEPEKPVSLYLKDGKDSSEDPAKDIDAAILGGEDGGPGKRTGLYALEDVPEVSIVTAPGVTDSAEVQKIITHCENMGNRVCILDMPEGSNKVTELQEYRRNFSSSYAALYHPWIQAFDPAQSKSIYMPPSGAMAGIYARTDNSRGVFKAPANEVIRNCTGLQTLFGKPEQDMLNPAGVNLIRNIPGLGIRVWGARTLSDDSSWKYINVRRLFIYIEETIRRNTAWAVFEPNDQLLWTKVRGSIVSFLSTLWRDGALFGATEEEAFFVNLGKGSTMTDDDILNGRLVCVIGVAPVRPAEFVIFRITQIMEQNG